ncbi:MAG: DUF3048 domain-containing protein [Clostridia bacterium]|nr:DUF3048 domain-containing protein [Clostridia bacterium]
MAKKILAMVLCLCMVLLFAACGGESKPADTSSVESEPPKPVTAINPLTGLEMDLSLAENKATAVTINNLNSAQKVQTGLGKFDVVYEAPVEGGITRLLALTNNISALPQIGTVRSARQVFLELAYGHNANYVHAGYDAYHFHQLKKRLGVDTFDINTGRYSNYGFRQKNGLASEHTMYTSGEKLAKGFSDLGWDTKTTDNKWINFLAADETKTPTAPGNSVKVNFSASYGTNFTYNTETGKYTKQFKDGKNWTDYLTGETAEFTNVYVLYTTVTAHNCTGTDNKGHRDVKLSGGNGYYFTKGGCEEITWSKASTGDPITFKNSDGTAFSANAGNSYICLIDTAMEVVID